MKFALNYSHAAAALLNDGKIQFDIYKSADWPDMIAQARAQRPVYVHYPLMAGRGAPDAARREQIETMRADTETPFINTHLAPHAGQMDMPLDTTAAADRVHLIDAMLADIRPLVDHWGAERVILENAIWDPTYAIPRPVLEADVIRHVVYESGCGFLLDTAHAVASARYLGIDDYDYVAALPLDRLRELHVTGLRYEDGRWNDHYELTDADWQLAEWAVDNVRIGLWAHPWVLAFEYGGTGAHFVNRTDPTVIARQVPRLYELTHSVPVNA